MVTSKSIAMMDQTVNGKERDAKAKEGTATENERIKGTVSMKGKERTTKEKDGAMKGKEQAFVWTDDEV